MLIKNILERIEINRKVSLAAIFLSALIVLAGFFLSYQIVRDSRKSIYVLDQGTPILLERSDYLVNRPVEYRSQVELFHRLFFTLPPDDQYIKENIEKSLYLIDETGKKEYTNLREKGYYNQLISSSSMLSVSVDSIRIELEQRKFYYYGKQTINRKTSLITRRLHTEGSFKDMPRTPHNPHGVMLLHWQITDNSELSTQSKFSY